MNDDQIQNLVRPPVTEAVRKLISAAISSTAGMAILAHAGVDATTAVAMSVPLGALASWGLTKLFDWTWAKFGPQKTGS